MKDHGGADPFLRSPVSRVFSSGMLMEVAQLPPPSVMMGYAAGPAAEDCVRGWRGSGWTLQPPCLQKGWRRLALRGLRAGMQHSAQ